VSPFGRRRQEEPSASPPLPVPAPDTWIHLLADEEAVAARVERSRQDQVDVVLESAEQRLDAEKVLVQWPSTNGLYLLKARVQALGPGRWRLTPTAPVEQVQRRSFVRVPASVRVMLRTAERNLVRATSADLSETGVSVVVPAEAAITVGQQVQVSLMLHNTPVTMTGDVVRAQRTSTGDYAAGIQFRPPYATDIIRRWVLAAQLNERARRRAE
jgi:hypothetical protein